ncbi:MAG: hypothetical protein NXI21_18840 [Alphaproteobacteria bacterium]|nr:hypothetical protein [Alphaproteobacteria bacterium]
MSERVESILLNNIPAILRLVAGNLDAKRQLAVRNALVAMAGELSTERTIAISDEDGQARIEGLMRAHEAVEQKLSSLPADKRGGAAAEQLALCGQALAEMRDSFELALEEGLSARVNVRRLADAIQDAD